MSLSHHERGRPVTFRQDSACPYFSDGRVSTIEFLLLDEKTAGRFHLFLEKGYRRLGRLLYRTVCDGCAACLPIRVDVASFRTSRSQCRTLRKNADLRVEVNASSVSHEKLLLYEKYVTTKHRDGEEADYGNPEEALLHIHYGYRFTVEMDYYEGERLVGVGVVDRGPGCLSSNYFYYDTDLMPRRPGIFSILQEIDFCKLLGARFYYLGYYIEETRKMAYKKFFRPNEVLREGLWKTFLPQ